MPSKEEEKPQVNGQATEDKSTDKGKGKATEADEILKDGKTAKDGKADDKVMPDEELSEEDQKLKEELDLIVERLTEDDASLYKSALEAIKDRIKTSTSSMTAVPAPLKFLRPHYERLEEAYAKWPQSDDKTALADVLSVLGMTTADQDKRKTLSYRLLAPSSDLGSWGHEYMRHLSLQIGQEYQARLDKDEDTDELTNITNELVPFFLQHNAEADAVDILSELEMIEDIPKYLNEHTYARVALYMVSMVPLLPNPDNLHFLRTAYQIYSKYKQYTQAMAIAIRLNDQAIIQEAFNATDDKSIRRQLGFLMGRQRISLELTDEEQEADPELAECINNTKLPEYFKQLGKELNILEPKTPEDIYKTHLESSRTAGLTNTDSARHNLASAFVNAFVNAGFGEDKLMLTPDSKTSWVWKTKDEGMMSTAASLGMLLQWDIEGGLDKVDAFTYLDEDYIKAGAFLASGMVCSGVRNEADPALALLGEDDKLAAKSVHIRMASIMGLGLAYAGSNKEDLLEKLLPLVTDTSLDMQISAMAALALGLIFVGSAQSDILEAIIQTMMDDDRSKQLKDKWTRFMSLGLALLYFGQQEEVEVMIEALKAVDHPMARATQILAEICAWAGSGAVLKIQELLHILNDTLEEDSEDTLMHSFAVIGLSLVAMGEDVGQDMILRQFGHLMHYGQPYVRSAVPLAMGLISPSNPQMKVYDTLSRYSHDTDIDVAVNAIFSMGLLGAGTNNARLAQLLRQLASYYHRDANALFMVRIAQGLLHMGKGTLSLNPFHTDRQVLSKVGAAGLLAVLTALIDPKDFILKDCHYLLYFLVTAMNPRFLVTLDEELKPITVNVRVGQAVDVVGQAGRPKTITGWQTQSTPVLLGQGERAELEDEEYIALANTLEGIVILRKVSHLHPVITGPPCSLMK